MEHRTSGSLLFFPPVCLALRALPARPHALCPVALLSLLPKQTWRGRCLSASLCLLLTLLLLLQDLSSFASSLWSKNCISWGMAESRGAGPRDTAGSLPLLVLTSGAGVGSAVWHGWKQRMCLDEEGAEGRAAARCSAQGLSSSCASARTLSPLSPWCQVAF